MKTNKDQKTKSMSPAQEHKKQAWRAAAQRFSALSIDLIDSVESERLRKLRSKRVGSPFPELDISRPGFFVLMCLSAEPSIRSSELAKRWGVERSAISGVTKTLEVAGYITQSRDLNDKREHVITLTNNGKQFFKRALNRYSDWLFEASGRLSKE